MSNARSPRRVSLCPLGRDPTLPSPWSFHLGRCSRFVLSSATVRNPQRARMAFSIAERFLWPHNSYRYEGIKISPSRTATEHPLPARSHILQVIMRALNRSGAIPCTAHVQRKSILSGSGGMGGYKNQ